MTKYLTILTLAAGVLTAPASVFAQSFKATLVGSVADATGAVLPGATITATHRDTGAMQTTVAAEDGSFTIVQLAPGRYEVSVELSGFRRHVQSDVVLETDQVRRLAVQLQVGEVSESFVVTAPLPVITTDSSSKGELITTRQIEDLPLNGRNYSDLALLVPGVYRRPADDDQGEGLATAGTRTDASNFILDGVVNRSDRNASSGTNASVDAIREFKVQTSTYSAEFGRTAGAQINVVSKSGTNQLTGTMFDYVRDDMFDANNFFTAPGAQKSLTRHQFGGTVGGPLRRHSTFYFASYERTRERRSESAFTTAPNAAWLQGDFRNVRGAGADGIFGNADDTNRIVNPFTRQEFPTPNVIPASMFDRVSQQMLRFLPAANLPGTLDRYAATGLSRTNGNKLLTKFDHRVSAANSLSVRWARQWSDGYDPFPSARNFYPGFGRDTDRRNDNVAVSDTHIFGPRLVNEARVGVFDQRNQNLGELRGTDYISEFGIPGLTVGPAYQGFPAIRIDGFSEFGDRPNDPFIYDIQNLQFFNVLTWLAGSHQIKVGVDMVRSHYVEADVRNVRGDFRFRGRNTNPNGAASSGFRSFADFLIGLPDSTQRQVGTDPADMAGWQSAFFIQDDWRVTPQLTLNLGLRYEYQTALSEKNNRLANFVPELGRVVIPGEPGFPDSLVETDRNNIGPRAGFAYRPSAEGRTVIRGGAGIFFSMETFNPIRQQVAVSYPFLIREEYTRLSSNPALLTFSNPFPGGRGGVRGLNTPFGMNADYRVPEFYQYNLTVERELTQDLAVEAGYVGSQGRHLGIRFNVNQPIPVGLDGAGAVVTVRPFPEFGDIQYQDQIAESSYNALQIAVRRRSLGGLTLLASYTLSRATDTASSTNNSTSGTQKFPQDANNLAAERALSDFHRRHQFSTSFNYDIPVGRGRRYASDAGALAQGLFGGWQISGIVTALSGRPFTPQYSSPNVAQQRPDLVGDPTANIPPGFHFNPAAFARPVATPSDPNLFGNAGRNSLIGPSFHNVDLSLAKTFRLGGGGNRLQFRADVFNAFNTTNFQVPVFLLDRSDVGLYTSTAAEAREFQFALKFMF